MSHVYDVESGEQTELSGVMCVQGFECPAEGDENTAVCLLHY